MYWHSLEFSSDAYSHEALQNKCYKYFQGKKRGSIVKKIMTGFQKGFLNTPLSRSWTDKQIPP